MNKSDDVQRRQQDQSQFIVLEIPIDAATTANVPCVRDERCSARHCGLILTTDHSHSSANATSVKPVDQCQVSQVTANLSSHVAGLTMGPLPSTESLKVDDNYETARVVHSSLPRPMVQTLSSSAAAADHRQCKVINGYLFGPLLGEGSYSRVKHCLHLKTLTHRAVKIMKLRRLKHAANTYVVARKELEIMLMLKRNARPHPNIIQLHDFLDDQHERQKMYLFLDVAVCSIQDIIDHNPDKPMPAWQLQGYFRQLIEGIDYLHSEHIVHNDIKPGNLLLTRDETLKICDFGSAEVVDLFSNKPLTTKCRATPAYQAPEVSGDNVGPFDGFKLDVWSAGVCVYVLATTQLPFNADNIYVLFQTIEKGDYIIPDWVESSLSSLIAGMMCKDWERRMTLSDIRLTDWYRKKHPFTLVDRLTPPAEMTDTSLEVMRQDLENFHGHRMPRTRSEGGTITLASAQHQQRQSATIGSVPGARMMTQRAKAGEFSEKPEKKKVSDLTTSGRKKFVDDNGGTSMPCHVN